MEYGRIYNLDLTGVATREDLHRRTAEALGFPEWYGMNLDGLYDMLTQMQGRIYVWGWDEAALSEDEYGQIFRGVFEDAMWDTPGLLIEFRKDPLPRT